MELRGWEFSGKCSGEESVAVLGLRWFPVEDVFTLNPDLMKTEIEDVVVTKRKLLSTAQKVLDPIGYTCPATLKPKLWLQEFWSKNITKVQQKSFSGSEDNQIKSLKPKYDTALIRIDSRVPNKPNETVNFKYPIILRRKHPVVVALIMDAHRKNCHVGTRGRKYKVKVGSSFFNWHDILSGIPQGSILGPLSFITFTADVILVLKYSHVRHVDDIKIFNNARMDHAALQVDLEAIETWSQDWSIPLTEKKCAVQHIGNNNPKHTYLTSKGLVASVNKQVDLGIEINSKLSWSQTHHVNPQKRKLTFLSDKEMFPQP
ncbi:hypothetical protein JTB14_002556 [Gonioctena quinquepunctata]|nr:hypothetical protein JTB14_002556 [Gonioctena quinquepunctata]